MTCLVREHAKLCGKRVEQDSLNYYLKYLSLVMGIGPTPNIKV